MQLLRVVRGILKTALVWGAAWIPLSLFPLSVAALLGADLPPRVIFGPMLLQSAMMGVINGIVFGSVVAIAGRRKTFAGISLKWIAVCGAVGGALFPFLARSLVVALTDVSLPLTSLAATLVTNAVLGAGLAATSLALARRAPALPRAEEPAPEALEGIVKSLAFLFAIVATPAAVFAQSGAVRPTVAVVITAANVPPGDSVLVVNSVRRGLEADSVVEFLERPPRPGQAPRPATHIVTAIVRPVGERLVVNTRTFNVLNSQIVARENASTAAASLADSLTAIGRRIARAVAADKP